MDNFVIPKITTTPGDIISPGDQPRQSEHIETNTKDKNNGGTANNNTATIPNHTNVCTVFSQSRAKAEVAMEARNKDLHTTSCSSIENDTIYLLVSGKNFCISKTALMSFPNTKLGKLAIRHNCHQGRIEYVFDRNSKIVASILDFYRTGELHLPRNLCSLSIRRELRYWDISDDLISECCYGRYKDALKEMSIVDELEKVTRVIPHPEPGSYKDLIWNIMEKPGSSQLSWIWLGIYVTFITLSVVLVSISTMLRFRVDREIQDHYGNGGSIFENLINTELSTTLSVIDVIGLVFFTIEPLVRLWACPSPRTHLKEFLNLLDLLLALDHWTCFCLEASDRFMNRHRSARIAVTVCRSVLSLRVLRIFHLTRKNVKTKVLLLTFRASLTDICLLLLGLSIGVMTFATLIYYAEMIYDTENFKNIPEAIWWAIITMTTVGYGDYYPTTFPGYVVGVACALSGLLLLSMPIAVTATNFNTYYCGLVAREQRLRRVIALRNCESEAFKKKRQDSDGYISSDAPTMTTNFGNESKDDVFWLDDFSDFKFQYQSDGALNIRGVSSLQDRTTEQLSPLSQTTSENSLCPPKPASSRIRFANNHIMLPHNNVEGTKPKYLQSRPKSNLLPHVLSTSSLTKKVVPNYNSMDIDRNSNHTHHRPLCDSKEQHNETRRKRLDSVDNIKRRKKKYRQRKKLRGSTIQLDNIKCSSTQEDVDD